MIKLIKYSIILLLFFSSFFPNSFSNAQSDSNGVYYLVQTGDTLGSIALKFNVTVDELMQVNGLSNPDILSPGQQLLIPGLSGIQGLITPIILTFDESVKDLSRIYSVNLNSLIILNKITSLSTYIAGREILIPIAEETKYPHSAQYNSGSTILELAVLTNTNLEVISSSNKFNSYVDIFPGENLFFTEDIDLTLINSITSKVDFSVSPLPLKQGATATVSISSTTPISVIGTLNGSILHFFAKDNITFTALQGIYALAEPGITTLNLSITYASGLTKDFHRSILLTTGNFLTDAPLIVDPSTIDPSITGPENEKIQLLVSQFTPQKLWTGVFMSPAFYPDITSYFGSRRTYNNDPTVTFHGGVDFGGGETLPIVAPADGKVVFAGFLPVRGNTTFIDHGLGVFTGYYHQSKILVAVGDNVTTGQKIGEVGNTGRVSNATDYPGAGAHLHWEVWVNGIQVNPLDWLDQEYP